MSYVNILHAFLARNAGRVTSDTYQLQIITVEHVHRAVPFSSALVHFHYPVQKVQIKIKNAVYKFIS